MCDQGASPACFSIETACGSVDPTSDGTAAVTGWGGGVFAVVLELGGGGGGVVAGGGGAGAGGVLPAWCEEPGRVTPYATPSPPSRRITAISHGHGLAPGTKRLLGGAGAAGATA